MAFRLFFFSILLSFFSSDLYAQKEFNVSQITVINMGDGRLLFREYSDEKPLSGEHRIIDGYRSEYILAEFSKGMYHGSHQLFKHNQLREKGSYKEGRKDGKWEEYYSDGSLKNESHLKEGKLEGTRKTYFTSGKTESEVNYKNSEKHGKELRYDYKDGKLRVDANYIDGKPDGKQTRHISSNTGDYVQIEHYNKGIQTGDYSETYTNGKVKIEGKYKEGKKDGKWSEYRKDGKPNSEITYKSGKRNGETKTFYTDGSVEKIINYVNDVKEGVTKEFYYDNGKLKSEHTYADDKKEGKYKLYYDDGTLREEGRCENGNDIYRKEYYKNGQLKEIRERGNRGWETIESYDSNGNQK